MEQQTYRPKQQNHSEQPAHRAAAETEELTKCGPLDEDRDGLKEEEHRRAAIAVARGQRDYEIVHDAADEKTDRERCPCADAHRQRTKQEAMRQIAKRHIPSLAPEFTDVARANRPVHERLRVDAKRLPADAKQIEQAEMQDEDDADHADPASQERKIRGELRNCDPE